MLIRTLGVAVAAACKFIRTIVASTVVKHDLQNRKDKHKFVVERLQKDFHVEKFCKQNVVLKTVINVSLGSGRYIE